MRIQGRYILVSENEGILGKGQIELLKRIHKLGSLKKAAESMQMAYSKAWKITKEAEETMGAKLMTKTVGGQAGGSSVLTEQGLALIEAFDRFHKEVDPIVEEKFQKHFKQFI